MPLVFGEDECLKKSSVLFLPMIPLNPTTLDCVYSTLKFIKEHAAKNNRLPICTFDQALWWKALQVLNSPQSDHGVFICLLGDFHTTMSFLGCFGYIMGGSGIEEAMAMVYAENTVPHMMSGAAVNRAIRAHDMNVALCCCCTCCCTILNFAE